MVSLSSAANSKVLRDAFIVSQMWLEPHQFAFDLLVTTPTISKLGLE